MQPEAEQATTLSNIAIIHSQRKEYKPAIKLLRHAIAIDRRNGDAHATAQHQINLGSILSGTKQYPAAEKELLAGLNTIHLVGDKHWEASACKKLGWLANDDPKKSVAETRQWFEKAEALYREIGDTAQADEIANLLAEK
jgi:tetratricopeptide (TPR) repeat protein